MSIFDSIILGIVEGITEFLPISSTGHLIVTSNLLGLPQTEFLKTFEIAIQLGAILSVVVLFWKKLLLSIKSIQRLIVAFIPTAIFGLIAYPFIKKVLLGNMSVVIGALLIGGILLIVIEKYVMKKKRSNEVEVAAPVETISLKKAAYIGLFQTLAFIPGFSRSGATIMGGMLLGLNRATIVEFSFLLAVPTMAAATGLDLIKNYELITSANMSLLLIGGATAFVVALVAIKFLMKFVQKNTFVGFGVYRIIFALGLIALQLFW